MEAALFALSVSVGLTPEMLPIEAMRAYILAVAINLNDEGLRVIAVATRTFSNKDISYGVRKHVVQ